MLAKGRPKHLTDMEERAKARAQKRQELQQLKEEKKRRLELEKMEELKTKEELEI